MDLLKEFGKEKPQLQRFISMIVRIISISNLFKVGLVSKCIGYITCVFEYFIIKQIQFKLFKMFQYYIKNIVIKITTLIIFNINLIFDPKTWLHMKWQKLLGLHLHLTIILETNLIVKINVILSNMQGDEHLDRFTSW